MGVRRERKRDWHEERREVDRLMAAGDYGRAEAALEAFQEAWAKVPSATAWGRHTRAVLHAKSRPSEEAVVSIREALGNKALGPTGRRRLRRMLLEHYDALGDADGVERELRELIAEDMADHPPALRQFRAMAEKHGLAVLLSELSSQLEDTVEAKPVAYLEGHLELPVPRDWGDVPASFGDRADDEGTEIPPLPVFRLENVDMVFRGRSIFIFDEQKRLIANCSNSGWAPAVEAAAEQLRAATPRRLDGVSFLIADAFIGPNYCHWLLDWLPRLRICQEVTDRHDWIIGNHLEAAFQRESLEALRVDEAAFVGAKADPVVHCEELVVPGTSFTSRHPINAGSPVLLAWWREQAARIRPAVGEGRRLYLVREGKRPVRNQQELGDLLASHGFESVDPGTLPFAGQVELFSGAELVVAPHGAGLTNILFAPDDCRVLELFPPRGGTASYMRVATSLGQDYTPLVSAATDHELTFYFNDLPIDADLGAVESWLGAKG